MMRKNKKSKLNTLEYNLKINNINGILQALCLNLVTPFASIYAKKLNASDNDIAMLNSYPAIFCIVATIIGSYLFMHFKNKKKITTVFFSISRSFFLIFILVQFFPKSIQAPVFVLLYGAMNFPNSIATMGWQSYLGDLFQGTYRGRAFSKRSSLSTISALIITLLTGTMLYFIPRSDGERLALYEVFFFIAFITSAFEIYSFTKHKQDSRSLTVEKVTDFQGLSFHEALKLIFNSLKSQKKFIDFCVPVVLFHFAWQMGWPIFFSYEYDVLHTNEAWAALEAAVSLIFQAIAYVKWQKLSEKKGNYLVMFFAIVSMGMCPFLYSISTHIWQIVIFTALTGSATAGTVLLLSNNLYETAPDENRTLYIAIYTVLTNITLMVAPILGMELKACLNIYYALIIVGILRLLSSSLFYIRYRKYKQHS